MARRRSRDDSLFEVIFDVAALLPWWASVLFALASYAGLHWFAGTAPESLNAANPASIGPHLVSTLARSAASLFQYLLPLLFLMGAAASAFRRRREAAIHDKVASDPGVASVSALGWEDFERLVAVSFERAGYRVVRRGGAGPDGGVDLEVYRGRDKYLVQCKHWKTYRVGVSVVRELYGVMAAEGAVGGMVVTSGRFTEDAAAFAKGRAIKLVDARGLGQLVKAPALADEAAAEATPEPSAPRTRGDGVVSSLTSRFPPCPVCGHAMVQRVAQQGGNAGRYFWGCPQFPKCRGTRR